MKKEIRAVVLCGGLGSRLRPFTYTVPKPLLPIGERPIIEIILRWLHTYNIHEVAVALGWRGNIIKSYIGDGSQYGLRVHYTQEEKRLGTVGPLTQLKDWIGEDDVFMMNGDILTKMNLDNFMTVHQTSKASMTVATKLHRERSRFGVIQTDKRVVTGLQEKPEVIQEISAGMYMMSSELLDLVPKDRQFDVTELMQLALWSKLEVRAYQFEEPWLAIEQIEDFDRVDREWSEWAAHLEHRQLQLNSVKDPAGALK